MRLTVDEIEYLRQHIPTMDRAWYAAQADECQVAVDKQHIYEGATETAKDVAVALTSMAREAVPDILALGLDPDDRPALRASGSEHPAVMFFLECHEASATFKHWAAYRDYGSALAKVENTFQKWAAAPALRADTPEGLQALGDAHERARKNAQGALKAKSQQRGNALKKAVAQARKRAAWQVFFKSGPGGPSLLARIKTATPEQIAQLAEIYEYSCIDTFVADAINKDSGLRYHLKKDNK